jgi:alpha-beta hydrolase superfamily lysophospholipase
VLDTLTRHHEVFAPTLAGHSGGPVLAGDVTLTAIADAAERSLDEADISTAHLAGNSLGGWVALELAYRGRARSVTALSPAGGWSTPADLRRVVRTFLAADRISRRLLAHLDWAIRRPRSRRALLRTTMEHGDRIPAAEAAILFADYADCTIVAQLLGTFRDGFVEDLAGVDVPIRIAWGERDRTLPFDRYGRRLLIQIDAAEYIPLPGVGHVPMYDDPDLVATTILATTTATTEARKAMTEIAGSRGTIHVHAWIADMPAYVAVIVHGIGEHAGRYEYVAERLVADGAAVYAPDHLGHGRSDGTPGLVHSIPELTEDLAGVVERARARHPGLPVYVIGHSMGGIIASLFAQRHPTLLDALVLSAPAIGGNPDIEALLQLDPMPDVPIDPALLSRDPAVGVAYASDPAVYHGPLQKRTFEAIFAGGRIVADGPRFTVPVLWLHGEFDALAPLAATRPVAEAIAGDAFDHKVYPGAQHEIFNETNRDEVLDDVIAFMSRIRLAAGPSQT